VPYPQNIQGQSTTEQWLNANFTPPIAAPAAPALGPNAPGPNGPGPNGPGPNAPRPNVDTLAADIPRLLQLYPDDPTVGAPFGTQVSHPQRQRALRSS
jgi:hypothetical protein